VFLIKKVVLNFWNMLLILKFINVNSVHRSSVVTPQMVRRLLIANQKKSIIIFPKLYEQGFICFLYKMCKDELHLTLIYRERNLFLKLCAFVTEVVYSILNPIISNLLTICGVTTPLNAKNIILDFAVQLKTRSMCKDELHLTLIYRERNLFLKLCAFVTEVVYSILNPIATPVWTSFPPFILYVYMNLFYF
jgi:hypothetical protein